MKIGEYLIKLRGDRSIREVSQGIGVSHTYLCSLEKGYDPRTDKVRKPTPEVLKKIAEYYDVPYYDLLLMTGYVEDEPKISFKKIERRTLNVQEVAKYLGLSVDMIYILVRENRIPHIRIGTRRILFKRESIEEWLVEQERGGYDG